MKLHYQSLGQGKPFILLHGLYGSGDNWGKVAKHFSQSDLGERYQVISVDLRNHGRSPHSESQDYDDMASDLLELCDALKIESAHLLGHSLGGKVAMQFATLYPARVDKLLVVDMAMRAYADAQTPLMDAMLAVDLTAVNTRSEVDEALSNHIPDIKVRQFLLMNLVKTEGQLQWRIHLPALKANYIKMRQAVCESAHYAKPALFIRGEYSDYVQDDDIEQLKAHFTQAQFASLPTNHWVHAEDPEGFIALVSQFLSSR